MERKEQGSRTGRLIQWVTGKIKDNKKVNFGEFEGNLLPVYDETLGDNPWDETNLIDTIIEKFARYLVEEEQSGDFENQGEVDFDDDNESVESTSEYVHQGPSSIQGTSSDNEEDSEEGIKTEYKERLKKMIKLLLKND